MNSLFSDRISDVPKSFIREILKATIDEKVISFAGGLPNRELFPVARIKEASIAVLDEEGPEVLQYSTSEGYRPLREWIAARYRNRRDLSIDPDDILITNGSQQGLDLVGKTFINEGDHVGIEEPGYLGAIQAFSLYRPRFEPIPMHFEGLDTEALRAAMQRNSLKLLYAVPSFQNPSGISHTDDNRDEVAALLLHGRTLMVEDDPYGELQFSGSPRSSYRTRMPEQSVLFGSFSKIFVPSFRLGWLAAPPSLTEKLLIAKQASDLHTNYFAQRILHRYLLDNDIDEHIARIRARYRRQRDVMVRAIARSFPEEVHCSDPEGGMFLWAILPRSIRAREVFEAAIGRGVAFVPGDPFYVDGRQANTMRLNFSCVDEPTIERGIAILGAILKEFIAR